MRAFKLVCKKRQFAGVQLKQIGKLKLASEARLNAANEIKDFWFEDVAAKNAIVGGSQLSAGSLGQRRDPECSRVGIRILQGENVKNAKAVDLGRGHPLSCYDAARMSLVALLELPNWGHNRIDYPVRQNDYERFRANQRARFGNCIC